MVVTNVLSRLLQLISSSTEDRGIRAKDGRAKGNLSIRTRKNNLSEMLIFTGSVIALPTGYLVNAKYFFRINAVTERQ